MNNKVHLGHTARKRFGQNFLNDQRVIDCIVSAINPLPSDHLVEIGPGLGALTEPVSAKIDSMSVVELDKDLVERLENHPVLSKKLTIHQGDALAFDFSKLAKPGQRLKVFGNLPYNISTPLMFHLFEQADIVENMHFMLQKEVVARMAAEPSDKAYGRLSVMTQYYCEVEHLFDVPPTSFQPQPKVDSAIVRLTPHSTLPHTSNDYSVFENIVKTAFQQRRKTLRNSLKSLLSTISEDRLPASISLTSRAEELSVKDYVDIANLLS